MTSSFATATRTQTRTLRYILRSWETYSKELITSPEILSEPPPTQDNSTNTVQETTNSQFRLFLSVTSCMPHTSSLEIYINRTPPPYCLAPHPPQAQPHVPTPNSPQDQQSSPQLSPTNSLTSLRSTRSQDEESLPGSPELFSPTPASSTIQNKWPSHPHLPFLNDPHALEEGTGYIIMQALP